jgi:two-component system, OmpR family, sensor kinase
MLRVVDRDDPSAVEESVAIVQDELGRMARLVEDLMAITRADMDDFVRPRELELVAWFEELELRLQGTAGAGQVRIHPPPPVLVTADPDRLAQAVLNLVVNAVVHTPDDTRVEVSARTEPGAVVVVVEDDGPGIPRGIRDRLFEPFVRAGDAPTSTGLGLSVVRAVAEAHGGQVSVDADDRGTRFELRVPWTDPEAPAPEHPTAELDLDAVAETVTVRIPRR